jgi:hypothetical protein
MVGVRWKLPMAMVLLSLSLQGGVITELPQDWVSATPEVAGNAQVSGDAINFDLWNLSGESNDQTVTLTFAEPVLGFGGWWDNRPDDPGTGMCVMGDCFGDAVSFVGFRGWVADTPLQSVVISTNMAHPGAIREHGLLTGIVVLNKSELLMSTVPYEVPVPEPASFLLTGIGLALLVAGGLSLNNATGRARGLRMRTSRLKPATRQRRPSLSKSRLGF